MTETRKTDTFGARLQSRLDTLQLSRNELANTLGITLATVNRWLASPVCPVRVALIPRLAEVLECEILWLTLGAAPEHPDTALSPQRCALLRLVLGLTEARLAALMFVLACLKGKDGDEFIASLWALDGEERALIQRWRQAAPETRPLVRQLLDLGGPPDTAGAAALALDLVAG